MPGDAPARRPQRSRCVHVLARRDAQDLAAHQTGEGRRIDDAERDDDAREPRAEHRPEGQGEHERREREHRVHEPHHEPVRAAARIPRGEAEESSYGQRDRHRREAGHQRDARAPDHPRQHVAPDIVGAERMMNARPREHIVQVLLQRVVRRNDRGEGGHHERGEQHRHAEGREARGGRATQDHPAPRPGRPRERGRREDPLSELGSGDR